MDKVFISIPKGVQYIGDDVMKAKMPDFEFKTGIYNKEITGCGATTFALREDQMSVILLVPRITLLKNKVEQTPDSQAVYGDIDTKEIENYLETHRYGRRVFICTWDSAARLKKLLGGWMGYHVYVDEWHMMLSDASFKPYVERNLIETVEDAQHQTWLSATPCLDEMIERIPHLRTLTYYQMVWQDKEEMHLREIRVDRPEEALLKTIRMYQMGNYPAITLDDGTRVVSKTMNGFLSSVGGIMNLVKQAKLTPENTDIICAGTEENIKDLQKLGFEVGTLPKKGEPRKMFTLCTSTAYQGMDFYGEDTLTVVCGNCKRGNTAVDIETELVQIAGRERLNVNKFRKVIVFLHNDWENANRLEDRLQQIERKTKMSQEVNDILNQDMTSETKAYFQDIIAQNKKAMADKKSYCYWDEDRNSFEMNKLSILSDEYEARVQHHLYENGMVVRSGLEKNFSVTEHTMNITEHLKNFALRTTFADKMKAYCELHENKDKNFLADYEIAMMDRNDQRLHVYYEALGPARIKANSYQENRLQDELKVKKSDVRIRVELDKRIKIGEEHTTKEWKAILNKLYQDLGIKKKGTRTQLVKDYGYKMEKRTPVDSFGKRIEIWRIVK